MLTDVYFCETLAQQRRVVVGDWGCWLWCARHFLRHFVRLSVGIENVNDIIADIEQALK